MDLKVVSESANAILADVCDTILTAFTLSHSNGPGFKVDILDIKAGKFTPPESAIEKHAEHSIMFEVVHASKDVFNFLLREVVRNSVVNLEKLVAHILSQ